MASFNAIRQRVDKLPSRDCSLTSAMLAVPASTRPWICSEATTAAAACLTSALSAAVGSRPRSAVNSLQSRPEAMARLRSTVEVRQLLVGFARLVMTLRLGRLQHFLPAKLLVGLSPANSLHSERQRLQEFFDHYGGGDLRLARSNWSKAAPQGSKVLSCGVLWGRVGTSEDKLVVQGRAEAPE